VRVGVSRRERVDARRRAAIFAMLAPVLQHVAGRVADLARAREHLGVVAVGKHGAAAAERTVEPPRKRDLECGDPGPKRVLVLRLADQVQVVPLNRQIDDPEPRFGARDQQHHRPHDAEALPAAKPPHPVEDPQRDMQRVVPAQPGPTAMRNPLPHTDPLATRTPSLPAARMEAQRLLSRHPVHIVIITTSGNRLGSILSSS
jgi:hypothetical protein